jgi:hypothetical protein
MDKLNFARPFVHPGDEADQISLVGMSRIAADAIDARTDVDALPVQIDIPAFRPMRLDVSPWRALALIADEHDVMPRVAQHRLQVVDDSPARAHAVASDDDRRPRGFGEVLDDAHMVVVTVHSDELLEGQRLASFLQAVLGVFVPEALQLFVGLGESAGEGLVEQDGNLRPVDIGRTFLGLRPRFAGGGVRFCRLAFFVKDFPSS